MTTFKSGILVRQYRGGIVDNVHKGYICVVDEKSEIVGRVGDCDYYAFLRSSAKPIQALDTVAFGLDSQYGITEEESVMFASSHIAESFHVAALESIIKKTGLDENELVMRPCAPTGTAANEERIKAGLPPRKLYHNCSGMHLSLMLLQRRLGGDVRNYYMSYSAANLLSKKTVAVLSELPEDKVAVGTDGCGVPTFAIPMKNIAAAFKNLACAELIKDDRLAAAAKAYAPLFNKYPRMIRGTGYICSQINRDPDIIAKGGGAGIYAIGLKNERLGIALKLADGTESTWPLIIGEILRQIGYRGPACDIMRALDDGAVYNDCGEEVGRSEAVFSLR